MFNKQSEQVSIKEAETIIGPSIKVNGDFHGKGNIVVEGTLSGSLKTASNLYVGDKAQVTANIEAKNAKISGIINGNIKVGDYLEVTSTAKISGDIEASSISIEKGAVLNGQCSMKIEEKGGIGAKENSKK